MSSERLAVGVLFVSLAAVACLAPVQSDTWWLLRAGQESWRTWTISLHDTYSHTAQGAFWPNHEWLTEVIFYGAHAIAGLPGLAALCALFMTATWVVSWHLGRGAFEFRFILLVASFTSAAASFAIRPQVFTMAAFVATVALVVAGRLRWLPVIFVLWTNAHGAVALGLVALGASVVAAGLRDRSQLGPRLLATVTCGLATLASPLGTQLWTFIPESMARSSINQLSEWQPPTLSPSFWPFWLIAAAFVVLTLLRWSRMDTRTMSLVAIAGAVLPLAVRAQRNVHIFLLIAIPAISAMVAMGTLQRTRTARGERRGLNRAIFVGITALASTIVALTWWRPLPSMGWRPITALAQQAVRSCPDRLYNTYGDGGVLIWFVPERKVFIDNRQDPYSRDVLRDNKRLELDGRFEGVFAAHDIRCAVVPRDSPTAANLKGRADWRQTLDDQRWTVFVRER